MQYVGILLIVVSLAVLVFGLLQHLKGKKVAAAPFHKTGHCAQNPSAADAKGMVSTEGAVRQQQPFVAPCSGAPCVYYEVLVEKLWEKTVNTENGVKTEKGAHNVKTDRVGATFYLDDGSGPVAIDAREGVDAALKQTYSQTQNVSSGDVSFGNYRTNVPPTFGGERIVGVRATEKVVSSDGNMYVLGRLANGVIAKPEGMLGKLHLHAEGRDHLLGKTRRNALIGFIGGALLLVPGVAAAVLGDAPKDTSCAAQLHDATAGGACSDRIYDDTGKTYSWKVTKAGTYALTASQPAVKNPIFAHMTVTDAGGKEVGEATGAGKGDSAVLTQAFAPGDYKVNVSDRDKGYIKTIKGGFGYSFKIDYKGPGGAPATASGAAAPSGHPATAPVTPGHPATVATPAATPAAKAPAVPPKKK